jgi:hypothetical protein
MAIFAAMVLLPQKKGFLVLEVQEHQLGKD